MIGYSFTASRNASASFGKTSSENSRATGAATAQRMKSRRETAEWVDIESSMLRHWCCRSQLHVEVFNRRETLHPSLYLEKPAKIPRKGSDCVYQEGKGSHTVPK